MEKRLVEKVKVEKVQAILNELMKRQVPYSTAFYILELNERVKKVLAESLKGNTTVDVAPLGTFEYVKFKNVTVTPEDLQVFAEVFAIVKAERIVE